MVNALIGKKIDQTQRFLTDGTRIPVTFVQVTDLPVIDVKNAATHGYSAVQVGFGSKKKSTKAILGHVKKANLTTAPKVIRELRLEADATTGVGDMIVAETVLKAGDIVKVTGVSKGKGFAGVVKRHNFRGGPRTHGQSDRERAPGSIGQTTTPGRVYRGKRMAGRMGQDTVSLTNLVVMDVIADTTGKWVVIKGLVPGGKNSIVTIEKTGEVKEKKFVPMLKVEEEKPATTETQNEAEALKEEASEVVAEETPAAEEATESAPAEAQSEVEEAQKEEEKEGEDSK